MSFVMKPVVRDELVATLEETLRLAQRLTQDARDGEVPIADLVAQASLLDRLDERRDALLTQMRRTASDGVRATRPGQPIREVVLESLDLLGWPQNAKFLEEYLWASRQLQLESRAFASLRRDERRAWQRSPGARDAYIVPALNPDGSPNPRWLTSSAWPLERRVVASPETERLFDLQKIAVLHVRGSRGPLGTLLERYAGQVLGIDPPPVSATAAATRAWRARVRERTRALIGMIRGNDDPHRARLAGSLADLPDDERVWGRDGATRAEGRRPAMIRRGGARRPISSAGGATTAAASAAPKRHGFLPS